jgi:arginyl-tRNA synthetase
MLTLREQLNSALVDALQKIRPADSEVTLPLDRCVFGPTKAPEHGDMGTSAPLVVSKPMGRKPMEVAEDVARVLANHPAIASAEAAKPGFVNVRLSAGAFADVLRQIGIQGAEYGHVNIADGEKVLLEFVSANPTGPMHIGHCRHAATGDALARILSAAGSKVTREFYINDAGVQVKALGTSFHYRCLQALGALDPKDVQETEEGLFFRGEKVQYPGEYLAEFAAEFARGKTASDIEALGRDALAWEARNSNLAMIQRDLAAAGVLFDSYVSERAIHDKGEVDETLAKLKESGRVYEKDGAQWLQTQQFGDDQDRVLVKGDGAYTYLVPDIAYHHDKFLRGYDRYINVFGADHGGYPPRLRAGIATLGHDESKLQVILLRLVFLSRAGKRVKFSKRAGNFVAMSDVVEEAGADATRWFMLSRSTDSEFEFDMDLALDHSSRNPVYKVLYAHARICTMLDKGREEQGVTPTENSANAVVHLTVPLEKDIILYLADFPAIVERAARELAPHHLPAYLLGLADLLNRYYSLARTDASFRILQDEDKERQGARLHLLDKSRQVLNNGLALLGITAPERLTRDEAEEAE